MRLIRSHGIGNDYLVLASRHTLTPEIVRALCDRHTGVGGDGVLEPVVSEAAAHGLRIWNPDGSLAEKSGNGLRIFARYLVDRCHADLEHTIEVGGAIVRCRVHPEGPHVTVDMGTATLAAPEIPTAERVWDRPELIDDTILHLHAVGMGNPHCVVFVDDQLTEAVTLDHLPWRAWGAVLEVHALFPNRTNVQFVQVTGPHTLALRVFERGAGPTQASGSSACAAAVAAVKSGRVQSPVRVEMEGGALDIRVDGALFVVMTGPVEEIAVVETTRPFAP
ncbi:MAG TPA: diaminopimelate epimerase [Deltaproteobacteria bacterium]|nr:diaminopimelate epimerase [Deltaproteobacteria bacterium]